MATTAELEAALEEAGQEIARLMERLINQVDQVELNSAKVRAYKAEQDAHMYKIQAQASLSLVQRREEQAFTRGWEKALRTLGKRTPPQHRDSAGHGIFPDWNEYEPSGLEVRDAIEFLIRVYEEKTGGVGLNPQRQATGAHIHVSNGGLVRGPRVIEGVPFTPKVAPDPSGGAVSRMFRRDTGGRSRRAAPVLKPGRQW